MKLYLPKCSESFDDSLNVYVYDTDPGKAAIEPAHRSQLVKDLTRKRTGPGIKWTECFSQP
jgi:hypothetical protein